MDPVAQSEIESFDYFLGDFTDFAENTAAGQPECELLPPLVASSLSNGRRVSFLLPTAEEAATAKKAWLPIIRRCTEAVFERKGHLRPLEAAPPNRGRIQVEYERAHHYGKLSGYEFDISDKMCLLLFSRDEPVRNGADKKGVIEASIPILWTEIANLRFEVEQPAARTSQDVRAS